MNASRLNLQHSVFSEDTLVEVRVGLQLLVTESFNKIKAQIIGLSAEFGLLCHGALGMSFQFILWVLCTMHRTICKVVVSLEGIEHAAQSRPRRKGGESFLHTRNGSANSLPNTRTANMQNY